MRASCPRGHPAPLAAVASGKTQPGVALQSRRGLPCPPWVGTASSALLGAPHLCVHRPRPAWREGREVQSWPPAALRGSAGPSIHAHFQIFPRSASLEVLFSFLESEFTRKAIKAARSAKMHFVLEVQNTTAKLGGSKPALCVSTIKSFIRGGFHIQ